MPKLKQIAFSGVPGYIPGLKPVVWLLILGALSTKTSDWEKSMIDNHETYEGFKKELIVKP
jgi:hypothetical protein|tara:strand:+ start:128 stop:310 length:183 start_codon:yes stop_codon:yes gene_type:complete